MRLYNNGLGVLPPIEVSGNMPIRAYGRGRTDRALVLDNTVGDFYPSPPPMADVHNPLLMRRTMQSMNCDYLLHNPASGMQTHWWHAQRVGLPTTSGDHRGLLIQEERCRQLGWIRPNGHGYNPTGLRYGSVLTMADDMVPLIQQYGADAQQPYPHYNVYRRFAR